MSVDPRAPREVLIVHGVQTGTDEDIRNDDVVRQLLARRLQGIPLDYTVDIYKYEDINDRSQRLLRRLVQAIVSSPVASKLAGEALDLVGDVVINLADGSTAATIRRGLRERILATYTAGRPCYLVAHSLGSIYAFDVINELMNEDEYFVRGSRKTWPVQALVTIGSPIGLGMFRVAGRRAVSRLGPGTKWFKWLNYWDRTDPIVSGKIFGTQMRGFEIAEKYLADSPEQGWVIQDVGVDTGKVWLMSHVSYWNSPVFGDGLFNVISN